MHTNALEELVILVISYLVPIVEACGAAVIMMGVIRAVVKHIRGRLHLDPICLNDLRLGLVESLIMGLEFQLAADVLKTAISPTWNQVLVLAALVGLRVVLGYVLERELHAVCAVPAAGTGQSSEHHVKES
jgi:uncharacterized membrane protein